MDNTHGKTYNYCQKSDNLSNSPNVHIEHTHRKSCNCSECTRNLVNGKHMNKYDNTDNLVNEREVWREYDIEFANIISSLREDMTKNHIEPDEAGEKFSNLLTTFLSTKPNLVREVKTFYKHKPAALNSLTDARKLKKELEKKARQKDATFEDKSLAAQALRHYDFLLKEN